MVIWQLLLLPVLTVKSSGHIAAKALVMWNTGQPINTLQPFLPLKMPTIPTSSAIISTVILPSTSSPCRLQGQGR
jgi:hypothetical protein